VNEVLEQEPNGEQTAPGLKADGGAPVRQTWGGTGIGTIRGNIIILGVCGLTGIFCGMLVWVDAQAAFAVLLIPFATVVAIMLFSVTGLLILAATGISVLLMNRFDETWAYRLTYPLAIPASTWLVLIILILLMFISVFSRRKLFVEDSVLQRFNRRFRNRWMLFWCLGFLSLLINHFTDDYLLRRDLSGEVWTLVSVAGPLGFVLWISQSNLSRGRTLFLLRCLVGIGMLTGLIMTVFGLFPDRMLDYLGWSQTTYGTLDLVRGRVPMGHPNRVAYMMLMLLPLATFTALGEQNKFWRIFSLITALLMFCGILFALSRSALINMILILIITYAAFFFSRKERRAWGVVLGVLFALVLAGLAAWLMTQYDFGRFWSRGYYEDASVERRNDSLVTSFVVWSDYPLLGIGPDAFYPRLDLRPGWNPPISDPISPIFYYKGNLTAETPHNFYTMALAEFGLLGALVFFSLVWSVLHVLWRVRKLPTLTASERETVLGLMLGFAVILLGGFFEAMFLASMRANVVIWIYAGLAIRYVMLLAADSDTDTDGDTDSAQMESAV
jgi:O-antigen ligase